ncbi:MAG: hypothetical protein ACO3JL_08455, partial [Myxococcota bacterium]
MADVSSCESNKECVAGRCVAAPDCRFDGDCEPQESCVRAQCRPRDPTELDHLTVLSGLGACRADGAGSCALTLFVGEVTTLSLSGLAGDELVVVSSAVATAETDGVVQVEDDALNRYIVTAVAPGSSALLFTSGGQDHHALVLTVVPAALPDELALLVVDREAGVPSVGVVVSGASAEFESTGSTDATGVVRLAFAEGVPPGRVTVRQDGLGVAIQDVAMRGAYRVLWPPKTQAAGFDARVEVRVSSTGDETGAVGVGLALPSVPRLADLRLSNLLGEAVSGALEVPVLGAVTIELPAAMTLEASLPLSETVSEVRPLASLRTAPGFVSVTAFEARYDLQLLLALAGSQDVVELALDRAADAEAMDVEWSSVGDVARVPSNEDTSGLGVDGSGSEQVGDGN